MSVARGISRETSGPWRRKEPEPPALRSGESARPKDAACSSRAAKVGLAAVWTLATAGVAFLILWPIIGGMATVCDDLDYSRLAFIRGGLWQNLDYWWHHHHFRPIGIAAGFLVDPVSLDARMTMLLQLPALMAVVAAIWVTLKRLTPAHRIAFPIALLWLAFHTSTSVSCWQHDVIPQTWAAACGLWLGIVVWNGLLRVCNGESTGRQVVQIVLLCTLGVLTKENFYGCCAAVCVLLVLVAMNAWWHRDRRAALATGSLLLTVLVTVGLFLGLRWVTGGISDYALGDVGEGGRYHARFGWNLLQNLALAAAGYFAAVPVHLARDPEAMLLLRAVPLLGIAISAAVAVAPWLISRKHPAAWHNRPDGKTVAAIGLVTFLSFSATMPMVRISELYMMGPNAGAAVLVTLGLIGLWEFCRERATGPARRQGRMRRIAFAFTVTIIGAIGLHGLVSRAVHFRLTWAYASELNRSLLDHQQSLPPDTGQVATVFLTGRCVEGHVHSQYVLPPAAALNTDVAGQWMNHHDPQRPVKLTEGPPVDSPGAIDLVLDGRDLPVRPHW